MTDPTVTEAEVEAAWEAWVKTPDMRNVDHWRVKIRAALLAAAKVREAKDISVATKAPATFQIGDYVEKVKGSSWRGRIVGTYSTSITPEGYSVESVLEPGSVQIYPASALRRP